MAYIKNKTNRVFRLDHKYIVDINDDDAERRMLYEGVVTKIDITSEGDVTFYFTTASNLSQEKKADEIEIYEDISTYKSGNKETISSYLNIAGIFSWLNVYSSMYDVMRTANYEQYVIPRGFFINEHTLVEAIDFPDTLTFTRKVTINEDKTDVGISDWSCNANFDGLLGDEVYATREEALANHQVRLQRFTGPESLI